MTGTDNHEPAARQAGWDPKRIERRLLALPTRRRIYEHVVAHPGLHLRRIVRDLDLALGTVEHHLHLLVKHGLLQSRFSGPKRRAFFARDARSVEHQDLLAVLRTSSVREIVAQLLRDPDLSPQELATRLKLSNATVAYHLQRLVRWGALEELRIGRGRLYRLRNTEAATAALRELEAAARLEAHLLRIEGPDDVMRFLLARIPPPSAPREERTKTSRRATQAGPQTSDPTQAPVPKSA